MAREKGTTSQKEKILRHLKAGGSLTPLQALRKFDCLRLGARIYNLKDEGYDIRTEHITTSNGKRVARYSMPV